MTKKSVVAPKSQVIAAFVAGLVLATAGWYFSDRLDIAFGQSSDINFVRDGKGWQQMCEPGVTKKERKVDGCNVVVAEEKCIPIQKHYQVTRTWTGRHISEIANPNKRSVAVTNYENSRAESRRSIKLEMDDYMGKMKSQRGADWGNLQKEYAELKKQAEKNRCPLN